MTLPKPTIVIFDMDGTTVRHLDPRMLGVMEFLDDAAYRISRLLRIGLPALLAKIPQRRKKKKPRLIVHRVLHKVRRKPVEQIVEPCPGVIPLLQLLKRHGIPIALVSNGLGKGYGHDILKQFDLAPYFSVILFRENIEKGKPNPEALLTALKNVKARPRKTDVIWYIGDRRKDVIAALAANEKVPGKIVPIAYGLNAAVAILEKQIDPEHIIMSFPAMREQLKKLLGPAKKAAGKKKAR